MILFSKKIDISNISKRHYETLMKSSSTGKKIRYQEWLTFFIFPLLFSILLSILLFEFSTNFVSNIITVISILTGLFFNLVILVLGIYQNGNFKEDQQIDKTFIDRRKRLIKELLVNLSYSILIGLVIIIFTMLALFNYKNMNYISSTFSFISYFLIIHYLLTILMILKRTFNLVDHTLKDD